jgi:3',5'-cyclic AMP phosphodiesterase CpdA
MTRRRFAALSALLSLSLWMSCGGRSPLETDFDDERVTGSGGVPGGSGVGGAGIAAAGGASGSSGHESAGAAAGLAGALGSGGITAAGSAGASAAGTAGSSGGGGAGAGTAGSSGGDGAAGTEAMAGTGGSENPGVRLLGAPLTYNPTAHGFLLNAVLRSGAPEALRAYVRESDTAARREIVMPTFPADDVVTWSVDGLEPGTRYVYEVTGTDDGAERVLYTGAATTRRNPGDSFTVALISDTHIQPREIAADDTPEYDMEITLDEVSERVRADSPDFIINLGDLVDYHRFGFNEPPPDPSWSRLAYLTYRRFLGDSLGHASHFPVIGNWDGESGCNTLEEIERSRSQRLLYAPSPLPETYPEGGSPHGDYYAFTWGDALFVVLNVMTYTPSCHLLDYYPGLPDDWTLGDAQLEWLRTTLANATSKWRFTFIHHTVGGNGGNPTDSAYGRGGGLAAYVGEQALVHELLLEHGVQIFFYGHDHVFEDMVVDGVHYTLPGSAGAPWKFTEYETGYEDYWDDSGHARLTVSSEAASVDFVSIDGSLLYSYTLEDSAPDGAQED